MLLNRADSHTSGARGVGRRLTLAGKTRWHYIQKAFAAQKKDSLDIHINVEAAIALQAG